MVMPALAQKLGITCEKLRPALFAGLRGMAASTVGATSLTSLTAQVTPVLCKLHPQAIFPEDLVIQVPRRSAIVLSPKQK